MTRNRGQAITIDGIIAAVLIVTAVLFIAPQITTPTYDEQINDTNEAQQAAEDLDELVVELQQQGVIKQAILDFDTAEDDWGNFDNFENRTAPPFNVLGSEMFDYESRNGVTTAIYLESNAGESSRSVYYRPEDLDSMIATATVTEIIYEDDPLQAPLRHYDRTANTVAKDTAVTDFETAEELEDSDTFPEPDNDNDETEHFATIQVTIVIYENV